MLDGLPLGAAIIELNRINAVPFNGNSMNQWSPERKSTSPFKRTNGERADHPFIAINR
jgi:hypothetical protein